MEVIKSTDKLNIFILIQIAPYLADNTPFDRLLELSLISKLSFKIFQNLISSYEFNNNHVFSLQIKQFIQYIKNSNSNNNNNNNNNNYSNKLIQYKDIEIIKVYEIFPRVTYRGLLNNPNLEIYNFLKLNCKNLKNVVLLNYFQCDTKIRYDISCNGFFIINSLNLYWDKLNPPSSFEEVIPNHSIDYNNFQFSFSFLLKYNPTELIITTGKKNKNDNYLELNKLENILNCKSIKSIQIENHKINKELISTSTNGDQQQLEEKAVITSFSIQNPYYKSHIQDLFDANFQNNTSFKKFEFGFQFEKLLDFKGPFEVLMNMVSLHPSLETFGFYGVKISKKESLKPLITNSSNISIIGITDETLDDHKDTTHHSTLQSTLQHCKDNKKIKQIIIKAHKKFEREFDYYFNKIKIFFNTNYDFDLVLLSQKLILLLIYNNDAIKIY